MSRIYKLVIALCAAGFLTSSAMAFSGVSIGVYGSANDMDTYGSEKERGDPNGDEVVSTTKSTSADVASFFIEYTTPQGTTFGAEYYPGEASLGSGSRTDTKADDADAGAASVDYSAKAEVKDILTMYVEPTYMVSDTFGLYGKLGATTMKVLTLESIVGGTNDSNYPDETIWGGMYGIGGKYNTSYGIFFKLEATVHEFENMEFKSLTGNKNEISADLDMESVRAAIGYNF